MRRSLTEADLQPLLHSQPKRSQMSSSLVQNAAGGDASTASLSRAHSDASTAISTQTTATSDNPAESSITSVSTVHTQEESDSESSSSSSSDNDDDDDDDDQDDTTTIGDEADAEFEEDEYTSLPIVPPLAHSASDAQKPVMDQQHIMSYARDLRDKLNAFLPKLQKANADLASNAAKLNMEHVSDNERHIEMNLGLGVLEQKAQQSNESTSQQGVRIPSINADTQAVDPALFSDGAVPSISALLRGSKESAKPGISVVDDQNLHQRPAAPAHPSSQPLD